MTGGSIRTNDISTANAPKGAPSTLLSSSLRDEWPPLPPGPSQPLWVFGYGSLIWKTNFPYEDRVVGRVRGYARKFWQGDVGHRGEPGAPGRVATLVRRDKESTWGVAFKVNASQVCATIAYLNAREQGYSTHRVTFYPCKNTHIPPLTVLVYISTETSSPTYLGPASTDTIARQVVNTGGFSGTNTEYVLNLASSMREIAPEVEDEHLFSLEARIKELLLLTSSTLPPCSPCSTQDRLSASSSSVEPDTRSHNRESDCLSVI